MKIFINLLVVLFLVFAAAGFYFLENFKNFIFSPDFSSRIPAIATTTAFSEKQSMDIQKIKTVAEKIFAPPPLKIVKELPQKEISAPEKILTPLAVIVWTNTERALNGFSSVKENEKLKIAAEAKLNDMFSKQYFDHISPEGFAPADLMKNVGYEFIASGENLAMGDFEDEKKLVEAWMNSPGHRANILNPRFEEIGVAVAKGIFKNKKIWMAVQEFGLPLSACPQPEPSLKTQIEQTQNQINDFKIRIQAKLHKLESGEFGSRSEYNQGVEEYNDLVVQYDNLIKTVKSLILDYNNQVKDFNFCLNG